MRKSISLFLPLVMLAAIAACADDATAPEASADEVDATADALALAEALGLPGTNADRETGSAPTGTSRQPCRFDVSGGRWVCPPVVRDGLTFHRSFAYVDGDGNPMRRFDPLLTAAVNTRNAVVGTTQRENATLRIRSAGELTVSGLLGEETTRTLDGREVGRREMSLVTDQGTTSSVLEFANLTVAVVIPVGRRTTDVAAARPWPLSGQTIRAHAVTGTRNGETHTDRWRETITFNGTAIVLVETVSSRGTRKCQRNLETGAVRCEGESR
jgi:hypothetical protein